MTQPQPKNPFLIPFSEEIPVSEEYLSDEYDILPQWILAILELIDIVVSFLIR